MAGARIWIKRLIITALGLIVFLAATGRWFASGCPVGFACGYCQSSLGGRAILASSDHLFETTSMTCDGTSADLSVGGKRILVHGEEVTVDGSAVSVIPAGCETLEIKAVGSVLHVIADGKTIRKVY